jgi:protoporphyrinogen oxidase
MNVKYLILGAGPAGLSFAATLQKRGEESFVVLEKEREAGGLCRSVLCDGTAVDIGGGHILDVRRKEVLDFLFSYMPRNEWNFYTRNTKVVVKGHTVGYPLEANIWQFPLGEQLEYLESMAKVNFSRAAEMPARFTDWIYWKFGEKIAEDYMIPYNQKIWSCDLNKLGTHWLEKLPDVSFRETLASCLERAPHGTLPAHAQFYYPKEAGYGEVFLRIAESLGEHVRYGCPVYSLADDNTVNGEFRGKYIVNTVPWHEFALPCDEVASLEYTSVDIDYYVETFDTDSQWTYYADTGLSYHRKWHRGNIIDGARGHWTETNARRRKETGTAHFENKYAYPLNTLAKPAAIRSLLETMRKRNVYGLGRWGEWEHLNSDVAVEHGIELAKKLVKGDG